MNLISEIFQWIQNLGSIGIFIGLMIEIIPSEIVLAYGGYLIYTNQVGAMSAFMMGVIGGVLAQLVVYAVGRYLGRPFLEKYGKYILIKRSHIDYAQMWFEKYGSGVIFTARFVPLVRHAISVPAGMTKMPVGRFTLLTTLAVIPWTILFLYLGYTLGSRWEDINTLIAPYFWPVLLSIVGTFIVYLILKYIITRSKKHD